MTLDDLRDRVREQMLISKVPNEPITKPELADRELQTATKIEGYRAPIEKLWQLTTWDHVVLAFVSVKEFTINAANVIAALFNIGVGVTMNSNQKIATGVVSLIVAVLAHFAIELPPAVLEIVTLVVGFVIGWLLPAPQPKNNNHV